MMSSTVQTKFSNKTLQETVQPLHEKIWYGRHPAGLLLVPFGFIFRAVCALRRVMYRSGLMPSYQPDVPVVVIGNLTVGGTGKTPLVIWMVKYLAQLGFKPGVVSRGYRGLAKSWPQQVRADSDPSMVGDEAIIIARRAQCPVAVGPKRADSVKALLQYADCDIIISDDGLQHYQLQRDVEILVVDGVRRFGNGHCLPAGPLREPPSRAKEVDLTVVNGIPGRGEFQMKTVADKLYAVNDNTRAVSFEQFYGKAVHAVAGIGNPDRFFDMLRAKGLRVEQHRFDDHHRFAAGDLVFDKDLPIVMTEKDAVKCVHFQLKDAWYLPIDIEMPEVFGHRLTSSLKEACDG